MLPSRWAITAPGNGMKKDLLADLRAGKELSRRQQFLLTARLSLPPILAHLSSVVMQYIDAAMVGRLGAGDAASVGLVASTTWLFLGLTEAINIGFVVLVAQHIGAGEEQEARKVMKQGLLMALFLSALLAVIGAAISVPLPHWLKAEEALCPAAGRYFLIYALSVPLIQMNSMAAGMLQASGNMRTPGIGMVTMCALDVIFNAILIFPTRKVNNFTLYGFGWGVTGAALGTLLAQAVIGAVLMYCLLRRSPMLHLRKEEHFRYAVSLLRQSGKIALPIALERIIMCMAQIVSTAIVAPLGTIAIAAHSFSITAESLCYMPGYGIQNAATTMVGQSYGAKRYDMAYRLGWLAVLLGMLVMAGTGVFLYAAAPWMLGILSPDKEVVALGAEMLRIEAFAEPFFAASIVAFGVFQGMGHTLIPTVLNFASMWGIRIPLSVFLVPELGLRGVWIAMCAELIARGIIFLVYVRYRETRKK